MAAFDFSKIAIDEANRRAALDSHCSPHFQVADAAVTWPYSDDSFDFAIDCFGSTEISNPEDRRFAAGEMARVVVSGGLIFAYLPSADDEFTKVMVRRSPGAERNTFYYETGKFEKTFDEDDIFDQFQGLIPVEIRRIHKPALIDGHSYMCSHYWAVFRVP